MRMWRTLTKYIIRVILFVAVCNSVFLLLSVLSPFVPIDRDGYISVCGLFFPIFFIAQVLLTLVVGLLRRKAVWFLLISLIISIPAFSRVFGLNVFSGGDNDIDNAITIASFNMQFSKPIAILPREQLDIQSQKFIQELRSAADIDIMAVQEYGVLSTAIIEAAFDFPYTHTVQDKKVGVLSRYPIVNSGVVDFNSNMANTCLWADIVIRDDTLRCYSFHLESNRHDGEVPDVITEEAHEQKSLAMMIGIVKYYNKFSLKRLGQVNMILDHARNCNYPILLCGDFNDTPQSYIYSRMRDHYQEAFVEVGKGRGRTIESRVPLLRIDYIFATEDIDFKTYTSDYTPYSDHYMLRSQFSIR